MEMRKFDKIDFISQFMDIGNADYNNLFFVDYIDYWSALNIEDRNDLLCRVSDSSSGIYSFFEITYRFLKVDFFDFYINLNSKSEENKIAALKKFYENPRFLQHDNRLSKVLCFFNVSNKCFLELSNELYKQGAAKAEIIMPASRVGRSDPIVLPPVHWSSWGKKYDF